MRVLRALPATLATLLLALPLLLVVATTPAAHAEEPESWAKISIDAVRPALPDPADRNQSITLSGRITNTSDIELSNLQIAYWRSLDPIQGAEGMSRALASAANDPLGARAQDGSIFVNVPSESNRTLKPGKSTTFTISATLAQLELPTIDGIYLIGVHLRGRTIPYGPDITLGRGRVFLPMVTTSPKEKVRQVSVVVLTSRPSLLRTGVLSDDHLADELGSDGRLTRMLEAAEAPGTSFAVDPALVEEAQTIAAGYHIQDADGSLQEGTGTAAAEAWLTKLATLIRTGDGYRLPYGNPDIAALVHNGRAGLFEEAVKTGSLVEATDDLPLLILPGDGAADQQTVEAAAKFDPEVILLSDTTLPSDTDSPVLDGPGRSTLIRYTAAASGGGPGPAPRNTPVKVQQRMLSDTWIAAKSASEGSPPGLVRLITEPSQSAGQENAPEADWFTPATLGQLLAGKPVSWSGDYRYTDSTRGNELPVSQLTTTQQLESQFETYADLLVSSAGVRTEAATAVLRSVSLSWRGAPKLARRYTSAVTEQLSELLSHQISITAPAKVSTTGRSGTFPITVRNNLPVGNDPDDNAVRVRVVFVSAASQRLTIAPLEISRVDAGEAVTELAQVDAQTNGTVEVRVRLDTVGGEQVGQTVPIEVRATQAGTTGWLIAIAAGIVLIGTTVLRIRQVSKERAAPETEPEPIHVSRPAGPPNQPGPIGHPDETTKDTLDV
ncbi:MAG: DUF6049 family protein [Microlunatus sp.]